MTQEIPQETPVQQLLEAERAIADLEDKYQELEDLFRDVLDLTNELEPGMLVERSWTVVRDRLIKEFMIITATSAKGL